MAAGASLDGLIIVSRTAKTGASFGNICLHPSMGIRILGILCTEFGVVSDWFGIRMPSIGPMAAMVEGSNPR